MLTQRESFESCWNLMIAMSNVQIFVNWSAPISAFCCSFPCTSFVCLLPLAVPALLLYQVKNTSIVLRIEDNYQCFWFVAMSFGWLFNHVHQCYCHQDSSSLENTSRKLNLNGKDTFYIWSSKECGPLDKGMANHFSILALKTPWTVWKGKMIGYWKRNSPGH